MTGVVGIEPWTFYFQSAEPGRSGDGHILPSASSLPIAISSSIKNFSPLYSLRGDRRALRLGYSIESFEFAFPRPVNQTFVEPWVGMQTTKILNLITALSLAGSAETWRKPFRSAIANHPRFHDHPHLRQMFTS